MRNLSRTAKVFIVIGLFLVFYLPVYFVWGKVLPSYGRLVANVAHTFVNIVEFSDTTYRISIRPPHFEVIARVSFVGPDGRTNRYDLNGNRKIDLATYNMSLWAVLFLASAVFISGPARWRFLLIAPIVIFLWHICDLTIFAKNTRWMLIQDLHIRFPDSLNYSSGWNWFWYWAMELNRRIIDPFLPLILWISLCSRSFFINSSTGLKKHHGK